GHDLDVVNVELLRWSDHAHCRGPVDATGENWPKRGVALHLEAVPLLPHRAALSDGVYVRPVLADGDLRLSALDSGPGGPAGGVVVGKGSCGLDHGDIARWSCELAADVGGRQHGRNG